MLGIPYAIILSVTINLIASSRSSISTISTRCCQWLERQAIFEGFVSPQRPTRRTEDASLAGQSLEPLLPCLVLLDDAQSAFPAAPLRMRRLNSEPLSQSAVDSP